MPCSKYPCQNGGSCVDLDPVNYKCFCKTNYYGYNCEYKQSDFLSLIIKLNLN